MSADLDMDAAEYVLGTLDRDERSAFAARLKSDSQARIAVAWWEARLFDLAAVVPDVAPPLAIWAGIERELDRSPVTPMRFRVIEGGGVEASVTPTLRRALNRWRAFALMSSGVAAALLVFVGAREWTGTGANAGASYMAAVNRGGDKPALLIRVDLKNHKVFVRPVAAETPNGKSLELWYIGANNPPVSMGVVDSAAIAMPIPDGVRPDATVFAVSVEPVGGSRTGGPTGPVVYSGELIKD